MTPVHSPHDMPAAPPANAVPADGGATGRVASPPLILVFWKTMLRDFRLELRAREALNAMVFYSVLVIIVFSFAFDPQETRPVLGGVLWLAFLFSGLVSLDRAFLRELPENALTGMIMSPASRSALLAGKCASSFVLMLAVELILLLPFAAFFNAPHSARWGWLLLVIVLGTWALAVNGTYFSAMSTHTRNRALMLPLLLLPVALPALLAMVQAAQDFLGGRAGLSFPVQLLFGYDVIFTALSLLLADVVLDID